MSYFNKELLTVGIFGIASLVLAVILLAVVYIIGFSSKIDMEKSFAYECGFQPFSETSFPFEVQFAVIAIMFLLFDIEVLYIYPLSSALISMEAINMFYLVIFFALLTLGIVYEVSRNILHFVQSN